MNYGPLVFLAAFFALAGSWFSFVLSPTIQVGRLDQTNTVPLEATYPVARPGLARQGLQVYRANGCAYCHSQQVGQTGITCDVVLTAVGTNQPALVAALLKLKPGLSEADAKQILSELPKTVLQGKTKEEADPASKALNAAGGKAQLWIVPVGPDIARGWGPRRSVAEDFLFDSPVMLGSQRIGPDLANAGVRLPDPNWHLRHLYAPRLEVKGSMMPPYRFLFEKRRIERMRSPDALVLPPELGPEPGYEIVPRTEARALAAYLTSLRADAPLFVAPLTVAEAAPETTTNSPAGSTTATNSAAATNAPVK
jgi:cbb3-type cytochrome oxidase cytochrome c subunit